MFGVTLYARFMGLAAILLALTAGAWWAYSKGVKNERGVWTAKVQADNETARLRERALQKTNEGIDRAYQQTKNRNAAAATATAGLVRELQATLGSASEPASTIGGIDDPRDRIINQCAATAGVLDADLARVAGKASGLQSYISQVCITQ